MDDSTEAENIQDGAVAMTAKCYWCDEPYEDCDCGDEEFGYE